MKLRTLALSLSVVAMAACSTIDQNTIANRLTDFGLSRNHAECLASELDSRLDDGQLNEFARFLNKLDRAETGMQALASLREIEDPAIARAVTRSLFACPLS